MEALLYNIEGKETGKISLDANLFGQEVKEGLIHRLFMLQRSNGRYPLAHTKTRGERAGSTRKIYKQKGTGRARMGSNRSPVRKKGGVAFGPRSDRNFEIKMNKKERRLALFSILSNKAIDSFIKVIDSTSEVLKTKSVVSLINNIGLQYPLFALLKEEKGMSLGVRNVPNAKYVNVGYLNPMDLLKYKELVFTKDSLDRLSEIYK